MSFVHRDSAFGELVRVVAGRRKLAAGLVEKDYWVTHVLWALQAQGWDIWFKGGTSLSKGFGLIERFSEDLDLKLEAGRVSNMPAVGSWRSEGKSATAARLAFFEALEARIDVEGATVHLDQEQADRSHRSARFQVQYPGAFLSDLGGPMRPFVLLEVGRARVTPAVGRDLGSFVHDHLAELGLADAYVDNVARGVRCVHPLVTLLEKLDAISRRFDRAETEAAAFVRHYEDAAQIIDHRATLPDLATPLGDLLFEMVDKRQLRHQPDANDRAFAGSGSSAWDSLERAHAHIEGMFWGPRIPLLDACSKIRAFIRGL